MKAQHCILLRGTYLSGAGGMAAGATATAAGAESMCTTTMTETALVLLRESPALWLLVSLRPSPPSQPTLSLGGAVSDCVPSYTTARCFSIGGVMWLS